MSEQAPPSTRGVRYVEVSPPTSWQTMAKTVREFDEDEIRDCKEDIDTLLVFAGLYSAVLSAFLVESYTGLQPSSDAQIVYLLQRIAVQTQSYTIVSGTINSTTQPPAPLPQFAAPPWAVRVNGLWFASLVVSLSTASFGMLVKQWLREYLAITYTAPQERLRARQYRKPGLEKWKVLEIAAVLPILIQLSLGLFFVGLCFFTASVDERMGHVSVPLVSGWAFLFVATTLAPVISPRCPYKIPLLKSMLRSVRTRVTMKIRRSLTSILACATNKTAHSDESLNATLEEEEEDQVVAQDQDDKDILLSIDAIMSDDNLLPTMWEAFNQCSSDPAQSLSFVVELISSRIGAEAKRLRPARLCNVPNLASLSRRAWDAFMGMLTDLVGRRQPGPLLVSSPDWLHKATLLLLSSSPYPLPDSAILCLRGLLADTPGTLIRAKLSIPWIAPNPSELESVFCSLFHRLHQVYEQGAQNSGDVLLFIDAIMVNDNLLPRIWDIFKQRSHDPMQSLSFIVRLIAGRLDTEAEYLLPVRLRCIPDLSSLSRREWDIFMKMLAELADRRQQAGPLLVSSPDWLHKTMLLLLSFSPHPLPRVAVVCLRGLLSDAPALTAAESIARWIAPSPGEQDFVFRPLSQRLRPVYESRSQDDACLLTVSFMYAELLRPYCSRPLARIKSLYAVLHRELDLLVRPMSRPILEDAWNLLRITLLPESGADGRPILGTEEGLHIIAELADCMSRRADAVITLAALWGSQTHCYRVLISTVAALHHSTHASRAYMMRLIMDAFQAAKGQDQTKILRNSTLVAEQYVHGAFEDSAKYHPMDMVRFCFLHIQLYAAHHDVGQSRKAIAMRCLPERGTRLPDSAMWTSLWNATASGLRKYSAEERWHAEYAQRYWHPTLPHLTPEELLAEDRKFAGECLEIMKCIENGDDTLRSNPPMHEPAFPDELVAALGFFILPEDVSS